MRRSLLLLLLFLPAIAADERVVLPGLKASVEILRDRWGVPHIYAGNTHDLFFAQGYIAARDRLFQLDLWRRVGTGKLAEVLGPGALPRDRFARLIRFRGDWNKEWAAYSHDAREIATAFTHGINAYIDSLKGAWPPEFHKAGYAPGHWQPEDVTARMAGLVMTRNASREVSRALDIREFGIATVNRLNPVDPAVPLEIPKELALEDITQDIMRQYTAAAAAVRFGSGDSGEFDGSNNWVVHGARTATGKPILAGDPHRPIQIPSLRKTVHLVAPGWNVIGAGEPALPGIALGHNERMGFAFTIVGIDQQDLYVERVNPQNPGEYLYRGTWRKFEIEKHTISVKGAATPAEVELRYTIHGPVIHEDRQRHRAYALRWVGADPGGAGYLSALELCRTTTWESFRAAAARYRVPSENLVYADTAGNIGWIAAGAAPIRKNWSGLLPVPGHTGEYEWSGFLSVEQHPQKHNPPEQAIVTANHNILPSGYPHRIGHEFSAPYRARRVEEMLKPITQLSVADCQRMQQDVVSLPARRFQAVLARHLSRLSGAARKAAEEIVAWDARMTVDSAAAAIANVWLDRLNAALFPGGLRASMEVVLSKLESGEPGTLEAISEAYTRAYADLEKRFGPAQAGGWTWGKLHTLTLRHPLDVPEYGRPPIPRPGDANTVNAAGGSLFAQTSGASYRQILDLADWDRSVMTNVPGESGDPRSRHYADLLDSWARGEYHPMPYTRKAVEAATIERLHLNPEIARSR